MRGLIWLSPVMILGGTWIVTGIVVALALANPEGFDLTHLFIWQHDLDLAAFNPVAAGWAVLYLMVFAVAYAAFGFALPADNPTFTHDIDIGLAARILWWVNLVFVGVTIIWVLISAHQVGGVRSLAALVRADANAARDVLLDNKLFTGMRLFYAALPATGCLAAAILALRDRHDLPRAATVACLGVIGINLLLLLTLPIIMSQRLLLLQFVFSTYVAACMVRGRLVAIYLIPLGFLAFATTWALHEAVTNPDLDRSVIDISAQKFAFYLVNDLWNTARPFDAEIPHTYGLFSLQFAMFFSLSDLYFYDLFADRIAALEALRGGGEFSLLSAPFVDFGPLGAALYLALIGSIARALFHYGRTNILWAAIYGQFATALLLSVHVNYAASQDFVFSVLVIALILNRARASRPVRALHA